MLKDLWDPKNLKKFFPDILVQVGVFFSTQQLFIECHKLSICIGLGSCTTCETNWTLVWGVLAISLGTNVAVRRYLNNKKRQSSGQAVF